MLTLTFWVVTLFSTNQVDESNGKCYPSETVQKLVWHTQEDYKVFVATKLVWKV